MDPETDEYIRESIENSLGLPISDKNLRLKVLASKDAHRRLQDQIFVLEERLKEAEKRVEQYKAEATMNAQELRRCIEEQEMVASGYADLVNHCAKLEKECSLYERDLERAMESCDELAKENDELQFWLQDNSYGIFSLLNLVVFPLAYTRLNMDLVHGPMQQKKRSFTLEKQRVINYMVDKFSKVGFIHEVNNPNWLANIILVKKANKK
ncbi:uncharacterized protein LOC120105965 [Phoenix dactylifera]|uniref:Uncharacterized protein LOC120105965 n=1 Tax=Phoenix dactylifera TaxID=42345 RepID=A0A8B8ZTF6_PHODC|nr:uncharacterized protein LOC120105965 [Phoenix dactylifera]